MNRYFLIVVLVFCGLAGTAQDSLVIYYKPGGEITAAKDSSYQYTVYTKAERWWHGKTYYTKNNVLQSEGTYQEIRSRKRDGRFDFYTEEGGLSGTAVYEDGNLRNETWYHPSGQKKAYIEYDGEGGTVEQKGWDESGKEIKGYIVQQPAQFKDGLPGWKRYLERNLDVGIPGKTGAAEGRYTVIVSFRVEKDGTVSEVKAENIPAGCPACAAEAVRVIQKGPLWKPAIQFNKPVIYRQRQPITFVVEEDGKPKKGKN